MNKISMIAAALMASATALPAMAAETLTVPFNMADGADTTQLYSGQVRITASGVGTSNGSQLNDAFYYTPQGTTAPGQDGYYQLAFGTTTLTGYNQASAAYHFIPTGRPAFNPTGTYTFLLNTGLTTPGVLHFGVSDGQFGDNTGAFILNIAAVPEPATWAMMMVGFGMIGFGLRRRSKVSTMLRFA